MKIFVTIWIVALAFTSLTSALRFCKKTERLQWVVHKRTTSDNNAPAGTVSVCGLAQLADLPVARFQIIPKVRTLGLLLSDYVHPLIPQHTGHPPFAPPRLHLS